MPLDWTPQLEDAAQHVADGRLSNSDIAAKLGVDRRTLYTWRQDAGFQARVADILAEFREEAERRGIARRERRLKRLNDHWNRLQTIIEESAEAEVKARELANRRAEEKATERGKSADPIDSLPGESTGLMGYDHNGMWVLNTAILKELRAMEKQAAIETGQWTEKREHTGKDGGPIVVKILKNVSMDDL